jgi:hypothetical protein
VKVSDPSVALHCSGVGGEACRVCSTAAAAAASPASGCCACARAGSSFTHSSLFFPSLTVVGPSSLASLPPSAVALYLSAPASDVRAAMQVRAAILFFPPCALLYVLFLLEEPRRKSQRSKVNALPLANKRYVYTRPSMCGASESKRTNNRARAFG